MPLETAFFALYLEYDIDMVTQIITVESPQTISLPPDTTSALGLHAGSRLLVTVKDGGILLQPLLADDLDQLCGFFASTPGLEADLYQTRREEEEHSNRKFEC